MSLIQSIHVNTPCTDKLLMLFGSVYAAVSLTEVNLIITSMVGLATLALMVARGILAWRKVMHGDEEDEE